MGSRGRTVVLAGGASPPRTACAREIVLIMRGECSATAEMRARLGAALRLLGRPAVYEVVDADGLPASDPRTGYGTPTVLVNGADLFGMPEPPIPPPAPT